MRDSRIFILYAAALALLCLSGLLRRRDNFGPSLAACACALLCPLAACWLGMDFSPSFTMMLLLANLALCALAEWLALAGRTLGAKGGWLPALHGLLFSAGVLLSLPSVYIYAVGDDWLDRCVLAAPLAGTLLFTLAAILRKRIRGGARPSAPVSFWLSLCAACFALFCGLRSPALLPYGAGIMLMGAALQMGEGREFARAAALCLGMICASAFAVAPMLF